MNDPNKVINVNLSSLLSLKAELLRKQAEVSKAKATRTTADEYVVSRGVGGGAGEGNLSSNNTETKRADKKNKKKTQPVAVAKQSDATIYEHEDTELLAKSQRVLVAKSKFYERMAHSGGQLNTDDNCLVQFNRKKQENTFIRNELDVEEKRHASSSSDENSDKDGDDEAVDSDEDFVEYVDCLGRTRQCVRKQLNEVLRRDKQLSHNINPDGPTPSITKDKNVEDVSKPLEETYESVPGPLPPMSYCDDDIASVASTQHDEQRAAWERKEAENLEKTDVHYQDVFFDEARQHGVGYYAFSTDEEERKRQQRELEEERRQTVTEQERRDTQREQRERIIAERVLAAKNRQRARLGLPPLDGKAEAEKKAAEQKEDETKAERKERKRAEKLERKKEKEAQEREQERQQHVRPWDAEKEGVAAAATSSTSGFNAASAGDEDEWAYKPERGEPMSQEQWNARKRAERNPEFAPVSAEVTSQCSPHAPLKRTNFSSSSMPPPPPPSQAPYPAQYNMVAPPPAQSRQVNHSDTFVNFQSTRQARDKPQFQRRSYESEATTSASEASVSRGAAIPPPASLDAYTLPSAAKKSKSSSELERSIEAGLRFLRNNCDKDTPTGKSSWTAKADY